MIYDVVVIGGGFSGLMVLIVVGELGVNVLLIDKGNKFGWKFVISGGGCCNVINCFFIDEFIKYILGNGCFLYSVFFVFNNEDIIFYFEGFGIKLKEEDYGCMFLVSNKV